MNLTKKEWEKIFSDANLKRNYFGSANLGTPTNPIDMFQQAGRQGAKDHYQQMSLEDRGKLEKNWMKESQIYKDFEAQQNILQRQREAQQQSANNPFGLLGGQQKQSSNGWLETLSKLNPTNTEFGQSTANYLQENSQPIPNRRNLRNDYLQTKPMESLSRSTDDFMKEQDEKRPATNRRDLRNETLENLSYLDQNTKNKQKEEENKFSKALGNFARGAGEVAKWTGENLVDATVSTFDTFNAPIDFVKGVVTKKDYEDRRTSAEKVGANFRTSFYNVMEGQSGLVGYLGEKLGSKTLQNAHEDLTNFTKNAKEGFEQTDHKEFELKDIGEKDFYVDKASLLSADIMSSLAGGAAMVKIASKLPKVATRLKGLTGKVFNYVAASVGMTIPETTKFAGGVYNQATEIDDVSNTEAFEEAFVKDALLSLSLNTLQVGGALAKLPKGLQRLSQTNELGRMTEIGARLGAGSAIEGGQEVLQNKIESDALNQEFKWLSPDTYEAFALGAIAGSVTTGGVMAMSDEFSMEQRKVVNDKLKTIDDTLDFVNRVQTEVMGTMNNEERARFEKALDVAENQGLEGQDVIDFAWEDFATNGGQEKIEAATTNVIKNQNIENEVTGQVEKTPEQAHADTFVQGEEVTYRGKEYKVKDVVNGHIQLETSDGVIVSSHTLDVKKKNESPIKKDVPVIEQQENQVVENQVEQQAPVEPSIELSKEQQQFKDYLLKELSDLDMTPQEAIQDVERQLKSERDPDEQQTLTEELDMLNLIAAEMQQPTNQGTSSVEQSDYKKDDLVRWGSKATEVGRVISVNKDKVMVRDADGKMVSMTTTDLSLIPENERHIYESKGENLSVSRKWKDLQNQFALKQNQAPSNVLKLLKEMKEFAEGNDIEFSDRYTQYMSNLENQISEKKQQPKKPKDIDDEKEIKKIKSSVLEDVRRQKSISTAKEAYQEIEKRVKSAKHIKNKIERLLDEGLDKESIYGNLDSYISSISNDVLELLETDYLVEIQQELKDLKEEMKTAKSGRAKEIHKRIAGLNKVKSELETNEKTDIEKEVAVFIDMVKDGQRNIFEEIWSQYETSPAQETEEVKAIREILEQQPNLDARQIVDELGDNYFISMTQAEVQQILDQIGHKPQDDASNLEALNLKPLESIDISRADVNALEWAVQETLTQEGIKTFKDFENHVVGQYGLNYMQSVIQGFGGYANAKKRIEQLSGLETDQKVEAQNKTEQERQEMIDKNEQDGKKTKELLDQIEEQEKVSKAEITAEMEAQGDASDFTVKNKEVKGKWHYTVEFNGKVNDMVLRKMRSFGFKQVLQNDPRTWEAYKVFTDEMGDKVRVNLAKPKKQSEGLSVMNHPATMEKSKHTETGEDIWIVKFDNEIDNWKEVNSFMMKNKGRYYNKKFKVKELRGSFVFKQDPKAIFDKAKQETPKKEVTEPKQETKPKEVDPDDEIVSIPFKNFTEGVNYIADEYIKLRGDEHIRNTFDNNKSQPRSLMFELMKKDFLDIIIPVLTDNSDDARFKRFVDNFMEGDRPTGLQQAFEKVENHYKKLSEVEPEVKVQKDVQPEEKTRTEPKKEVKPNDANEVRTDVSKEPRGKSTESTQGTENEGATKTDGTPSARAGEGTSSRTGGEGNETVGSRGDRTSSTDPTPSGTRNYRITDADDLSIKGKKASSKRNIEIIKLAKQIEAEGRQATAEEQAQLVQFVGWGGLKDALDVDWQLKPEWKDLNKELKSILTEKEFAAAQRSRLNAHYTSKEIIDAMYNGLEHLGFKGGRILEPSMAVGHFIGAMPSKLANKSKVTGIEIESVTGLIGKLLYPQSDVRIQGFQDAKLADNFYDVAIGNVPFGNVEGIVDPKFGKLGLTKQIHDYFFAKSMDKVREGGLMMFITSKGTMDKEASNVRKYLSTKAEFVGAIRLPSGAFGKSANTEVVTDIIILKKLADGEVAKNTDWLETSRLQLEDGSTVVNKYFADNPDMMLGKPTLTGSMYRGDSFNLEMTGDLQQQLGEAFKKLPQNVYEKKTQKELSQAEIMQVSIPAPNDVKEGAFAYKDGQLYTKEGDSLVPSSLTGVQKDKVVAMIGLRTVRRQLVRAQLDEKSKTVIDGFRKELNVKYDQFVKKYGYLNEAKNGKLFSDDPDYYLITSMEKWNAETKKGEKADIFTKDTVSRYVPVATASNQIDALAVSLNETGEVNIARIAELLNTTEEKAISELGDMVYQDPSTDELITREKYLSGNVREKLALAKNAAKLDSNFNKNVKALESVIPETIKSEDIEVGLGAGWVGEGYTRAFVVEHLMELGHWQKDDVKVVYNESNSSWTVQDKNGKVTNINGNRSFTQKWGTAYKRNDQILEAALNNQSIKVHYTVDNGDGTKKSVLDKKGTAEARAKVQAIRDEFKNWLYQDEARTKTIEDTYNKIFNSYVNREYDASHMPDTLPNMNPLIKLKQHQKEAVFRITQGGNTLLAHAVGAGKTFEMIAGMMEMKRLGQIQKPMWIVPNHLVDQMARDFQLLYPNANIFVPTKKDFEQKNRKKMFAKIANNNFDAVIMAHSSFGKVSMDKQNIEKFFNEQIQQLELAIQAEVESGSRSKSRVRTSLENLKLSLETSMEKKIAALSKDEDTATFEELGVDGIVVDEAHEFKNLMFGTKRQTIGGLGDKKGSGKAFDLFMKVRYLQQMNGGKGIVFATGTPISNSIAELYHMMRYLATDTLKEMGFHNFDAWADVFADVKSTLELAPEGKGFKMNEKIKDITNAPELLTLFHSFADVKTSDTLLEQGLIKHPPSERFIAEVEASNALTDFVNELAERADRVRKKEVAPEEDNMLNITNDGRKAALDMRIIDPTLPDDPNSKVNHAKEKVFDVWKKTKKEKGTQLVFIDTNTPDANGKKKVSETGEEIFSVYHDLKEKLIRKGIPANEIAFIHEANTDAKKLKLFDDVNSGNVRVLLGSSAKMGAGMNVQRKLKALHHLDVPWRPSDLEQREGRILRQNNEWETKGGVELYTYVQTGSFDAYMWQLIEYKAKMINKIMNGDIKGRRIEDEADLVLSASQLKALATGDPRIIDYENVKFEVENLENERDAHMDANRRNKNRLLVKLPHELTIAQAAYDKLRVDASKATDVKGDKFSMVIGKTTFTTQKDAGKQLLHEVDKLKKADTREWTKVGSISGLDLMYRLELPKNTLGEITSTKPVEKLVLSGQGQYSVTIGSEAGTIQSVVGQLNALQHKLSGYKNQVDKLTKEKETLEEIIDRPYPKQEKLNEKMFERDRLAKELDIDKDTSTDDVILDDGSDDVSGLALALDKDGGTDRMITPKTAKKISDRVAKALKTVLRTGYVEARKARGTFNHRKGTGNIKSNELFNLRVTAHELGHAFESHIDLKNLQKNKEVADELKNVAETLYPNGDQLKPAKKVQEGLAEVFQLYIIDYDAAAEIAPKTVAEIDKFVSSKKELTDAFKDVRSMVESDIEGSAFKQVMDGSIQFKDDDKLNRQVGEEYAIDAVDPDLPLTKKYRAKVSGFLKREITELLDFTIPWKDFQKAREKSPTYKKENDTNIVKRLRLAGAADGTARRSFESWAMDKYNRYIIHYQKQSELPTFLQGKYNELSKLDPTEVKGDGYKKRFNTFYKENVKKGMGKTEAKETAILDALSSRSLQEISVDGIMEIEQVLKGKKVTDPDILHALELLDDGTKKEPSFKVLAAIMASYRYAERYSVVDKNGKQKFPDNPIPEERALAVISQSEKLFPNLRPLIEEYTNNLSEILLEKAVKGGLATNKTKETVKKGSSFYIPTYKASVNSSKYGEAKDRKTVGKTVKAYKGSKEVVLNFLEASMYKLTETETAIEFKSVLDELENGLKEENMGRFGEIVTQQMMMHEVAGTQIEKQIMDIFETEFDIDTSDIEGSLADNVFKVFMKKDMFGGKEPIVMNWNYDKNGQHKPVFMRIAPDLYTSLASMKPVEVGSYMRFMAQLSSVSRYTALATGSYMYTAITRDMATAYMHREKEGKFVKGVLKGATLAMGLDERMVDNYVNSKAFMSNAENVLKSFSRKSVTDGLLPTGDPTLFKLKNGKLIKMVNPSSHLSWNEQFTRYAAFVELAQKRAAEEGISFEQVMDGRQKVNEDDLKKLEKILVDIAYEASELTTNFRGHGTSERFRHAITPISFLHGSLQGIYREWGEVKRNPKRVGKRMAKSMLPITLLMWIIGNAFGEEFEDVPSHFRDRYWLVPTAWGYHSISKPFTYSIPIAYTERFLDHAIGKEGGRKMYEDTFNPIKQNLGIPVLPIFVSTFADIWANEAWHGGEIVGRFEQDKPNYAQYDEKTSELSKNLATIGFMLRNGKNPNKMTLDEFESLTLKQQNAGVSPKKLDYAIEGILGAYGRQFLETLGGKPNTTGKSPLGITRRFHHKDNVGSRAVGEFYDKLNAMENAHKMHGVSGEPSDALQTIRAQRDALREISSFKKEIQKSDADKSRKQELTRMMNLAQRDISRIGTGLKPQDQQNLARVLQALGIE